MCRSSTIIDFKNNIFELSINNIPKPKPHHQPKKDDDNNKFFDTTIYTNIVNNININEKQLPTDEMLCELGKYRKIKKVFKEKLQSEI